MVATTDRDLDDPLVSFARVEGVEVFRGATNDVARRAFNCLQAFGLARIVRISGDSPFMDPALLSAIAERAEMSAADIVTNVHPRTYPAGMSVEVITETALRKIVHEAPDGVDREHVTRFAYRNPKMFLIENVPSPDNSLADLTLTVDTPADLDKAVWILDRLGKMPEHASLTTVVACLRTWNGGREDRGVLASG